MGYFLWNAWENGFIGSNKGTKPLHECSDRTGVRRVFCFVYVRLLYFRSGNFLWLNGYGLQKKRTGDPGCPAKEFTGSGQLYVKTPPKRRITLFFGGADHRSDGKNIYCCVWAFKIKQAESRCMFSRFNCIEGCT